MKFLIKVVLLVFFVISLHSCSLLRMIGDQEFEKVSDTLDLTLKNNRLTIPVTLNDSKTSLFFDTGSDAPFLYDVGVLNNKIPEKKSTFGNVSNFGNELEFYYTPLKIETELFKSDNTIFAVIPDFYTVNECSKSEVTGGFYGKYFKDKILNINFEKKKLYILDSLENTSYIEIESKFFNLAQVQIKLNVNGKSEWFHFDTGNTLYPLLLTKNSKIIDGLKYDFATKSDRLSMLTKKANKTFYYKDVTTKFGDKKLNYYAVTNDGTKKYKYNNVGIQFLKNYNWIIDYKNEKVYYESFKNPESNFKEVSINQLNKVAVEEGKLVVIQTLIHTEKPNYKLGDQVISVNETSITSKNICSYLKLLNDSDWNTLSIETRS